MLPSPVIFRVTTLSRKTSEMEQPSSKVDSLLIKISSRNGSNLSSRVIIPSGVTFFILFMQSNSKRVLISYLRRDTGWIAAEITVSDAVSVSIGGIAGTSTRISGRSTSRIKVLLKTILCFNTSPCLYLYSNLTVFLDRHPAAQRTKSNNPVIIFIFFTMHHSSI